MCRNVDTNVYMQMKIEVTKTIWQSVHICTWQRINYPGWDNDKRRMSTRLDFVNLCDSVYCVRSSQPAAAVERWTRRQHKCELSHTPHSASGKDPG